MAHYNGQFLGRAELEDLGVKCEGDQVLVHTSCVLLNPEGLRLGNFVRIDPFCIVSSAGGVRIGDHVHVGAHSTLSGGAGIEIESYAAMSHDVRIFTVTEDLSGRFMTNPTVPDALRRVKSGRVVMKQHSGLCVGTVVLPGVTIGEGAMVGAMSIVRKNIPEWEMWFGAPAKRISGRRRNLLGLVDQCVAYDRSQATAPLAQDVARD